MAQAVPLLDGLAKAWDETMASWSLACGHHAVARLVRQESHGDRWTQVDEKMLYRVEEAGHFLNMGRSTVFQEIAAGRLKSVRIGKSRRISRAALEEYVARLENATPAAS